MVHPRPQTAQGEFVTEPKTHLLIILSLVCRYYIEKIHSKQSNPFCKTNISGQKHHRKVDKCRNSSQYIRHFILSKCWRHPVQDNQRSEGAATGHRRPYLSRSFKSLNTKNTSGTPHQSLMITHSVILSSLQKNVFHSKWQKQYNDHSAQSFQCGLQ